MNSIFRWMLIIFVIPLLFQTPVVYSADQVLYDAARQGDTVSDIGCVLRKAEDGRTLLEVSILTRGQGAHYRHWTPDRPYVLAGSERLTPLKTDKFYASKESFARPIGIIVFAAIGTQYVGSAGTAEHSPGEPHEVVENTGAAEVIDRVGMAAGLGLLASQAKGQITGLRTTYDVTGHEEALTDARLKFQVVNTHARRQPLDVTVPVPFSNVSSFRGNDQRLLNAEDN